MVRSSPVITKSPTIRHYSAQSIRRETMRAILRDRKFLKDPLIQEVETFWKIVKRYSPYPTGNNNHTLTVCTVLLPF